MIWADEFGLVMLAVVFIGACIVFWCFRERGDNRSMRDHLLREELRNRNDWEADYVRRKEIRDLEHMYEHESDLERDRR